MRRWGLAILMMAMVVGAARADHTKEDARETSRKLQAILHPPPKRAKAPVVVKDPPPPPVVVAKKPVDPLYAIIVHALAVPFDEREREAHMRVIPKNAKELDAHLRRLDAALSAQHQHR